MPSLCGSAEATREWFRAFAARSFLTCRPLRPRRVRHRYFPELRCRHWPSPNDHRLGTPNTPAIRSTRAVDFVASLVRFRYSLPGCLPPCTDQTGILPQPPGTFTSRLSTDRSSSPLLDITTTATGLLVWGFFCQEISAERPIFLPSLVSLFDLKARFFIPTRHSGKPSRAGAVKAGRLFGDHPQGLALTVPSTAAPSNAVGLGQQDDDQRGARVRARIYRATTLYSVGPRTRTMMQSCASVRSSEAADPFSVTA